MWPPKSFLTPKIEHFEGRESSKCGHLRQPTLLRPKIEHFQGQECPKKGPFENVSISPSGSGFVQLVARRAARNIFDTKISPNVPFLSTQNRPFSRGRDVQKVPFSTFEVGGYCHCLHNLY
jgi:hypothetical protein